MGFSTTLVQITSRLFNQNYKGAEVSQSYVKTSSFHNITHPPQPLKECLTEPCTTCTQPYLLLTPFFALCSCDTFAVSWSCSQQDAKVQGCLSCCNCQQSLVPPQQPGAETTTLATVPSMPSHTVKKPMKYFHCPCRSTSWMFWLGFGHISGATALSLDPDSRGKKIHL